jgi:hypothetical protein
LVPVRELQWEKDKKKVEYLDGAVDPHVSRLKGPGVSTIAPKQTPLTIKEKAKAEQLKKKPVSYKSQNFFEDDFA